MYYCFAVYNYMFNVNLFCMNLEQIKNDYATKKGYASWKYMLDHLVETKQGGLLNIHIKHIAIETQKECLKLASEHLEWHEMQKITNENNIIK